MDEDEIEALAEGLDHEKCDKMAELVEEITTSGKPTMDSDLLKQLKKICKQSDEYVKLAYYRVFSQLEKEHAEIRLSAFQIMNELFMRSHCFRDKFLIDFQAVMDLTLETDPDYPLPPPKAAAKQLKEEATNCIQTWQDQYGDHYKKLSLGYHYLKSCKKVDFAAGIAQTRAEQRRAQQLREKQQKQLDKALNDFSELKEEIRQSLMQMESCLQLLMPDQDLFQFPELVASQNVETELDKDKTESARVENVNKEDLEKERKDKVHRDEDKKRTKEQGLEIKSTKDEKCSEKSGDKERKSSHDKDRKSDKKRNSRDKGQSGNSSGRSDKNREKTSRSRDKDKSDENRDKNKSERSKDKDKSERIKDKDESERSEDKDRSERSKDKDNSARSKDKDRSERRRDKDRSKRTQDKDRSERSKDKDRSGRSKDKDRNEKSKDKDRSGKSKDKDNSEKSRDEDKSSRTKDKSDSSKDRDSKSHSKSHHEKDKSRETKRKSSHKEKDSSESEKKFAKLDSKLVPTQDKKSSSEKTEKPADKCHKLSASWSRSQSAETNHSKCNQDFIDEKDLCKAVVESDMSLMQSGKKDMDTGVLLSAECKEPLQDSLNKETDVETDAVIMDNSLSDIDVITSKEENDCEKTNSDKAKDAKEENVTQGKIKGENATEEGICVKKDYVAEVVQSVTNVQINSDVVQEGNDSAKAGGEVGKEDQKEGNRERVEEGNREKEDKTGGETEDDDDEAEEFDYSEDEAEAAYVRQRGLGGVQQFSVNIELQPDMLMLEQNQDNEDVINVVKDTLTLIDNKFLPIIQKQMTTFTKSGIQEHIRKGVDLKTLLQEARKRILKLRLKSKDGQARTVLDEEEDSDFEEVPDASLLSSDKSPKAKAAEKSGKSKVHVSQEAIAELAPKTNKSWNLSEILTQGDEYDPTSYAAAVKRSMASEKTDEVAASAAGCSSDEMPSTSRISLDPEAEKQRQELLKIAPKVPYNTDLTYWGEKIEAPLVAKAEHRFWVPNDVEEKVDQTALSEMTTRMMTYTGEFEPVKWACRAPLPSGMLCPRMDRIKCPFHGKIIGRDNFGIPTDPNDRIQLRKQQEKEQEERTPDWEDPELQREIAAATGVDVSRKGKGRGKGKEKKKSNLTNIKKVQNTSRVRLEKKVLNVRAMSRVATALNGIDAKKIKDKFGDQFHYSIKNSGHG